MHVYLLAIELAQIFAIEYNLKLITWSRKMQNMALLRT